MTSWDKYEKDVYSRLDNLSCRLSNIEVKLDNIVEQIHRNDVEQEAIKARSILACVLPTLAVIVLWAIKELLLR